MSELTATNCGCDTTFGGNWGNNSCLWIIILLFCCGGNGWGNGRIGDGCGNDSCLWIILLLIFCGGFGNGRIGDGCGGCGGCGC